MLRSLGHRYKDLETTGLLLVVTEMNVRYLGAAVFDDLLLLETHVVQTKGVRIHHSYRITRQLDSEDSLPKAIVEATSVIACVDREGKVRRLPDYLRV